MTPPPLLIMNTTLLSPLKSSGDYPENIGTPSAYWFFTHRIPGSLHFTCVFGNPILVGSSKCCSRYSAGPISGLSCPPSSCAQNIGTSPAYWFFTHRIPGSLIFICVFDTPILLGSSKCCSRCSAGPISATFLTLRFFSVLPNPTSPLGRRWSRAFPLPTPFFPFGEGFTPPLTPPH